MLLIPDAARVAPYTRIDDLELPAGPRDSNSHVVLEKHYDVDARTPHTDATVTSLQIVQRLRD